MVASRPARRPLRARLGATLRWIHIYVSMLGFVAIAAFAGTGLTLNHPEWFANTEHTREFRGQLDAEQFLAEQSDSVRSQSIDRLGIVEALRARHTLRGRLADFSIDERECFLTFRGPAASAEVAIDRRTGEYTGSTTSLGFTALLNDLHRGHDTGPGWSLVIDAAAAILLIAACTGIGLLCLLKRRRRAGLVVAGSAGAALLVCYWILVR